MIDPTKALDSNCKKIKDILESLKDSATFNMSRGGRELFHTNFLAYILDLKVTADNQQSYEAQVKNLILQKLFCSGEVPKNVMTFRERSNLDLIIIPALNELKKVNKVVVIEAKLKSIPTNEQLIKYNDSLGYKSAVNKKPSSIHIELFEHVSFNHNMLKSIIAIESDYSTALASKISFNLNSITITYSLNNTSNEVLEKECKECLDNIYIDRLLLAPGCFFIDDLPKVCDFSKIIWNGWKLIEWNEFLTAIKPAASDAKSLFGQIVADYIKSTDQLLNLIHLVYKKGITFTAEKESFKNFYDFSVVAKDFRSARLHDLAGKVAYHGLQKKLISDLKINEELNKTIKGFSLDTYVFYFRSQPGLGIQFKMSVGKQAYSLGIQLQGNDYRHFIERNNCQNAEIDLIKCAGDIKDWICINNVKTRREKNNGFGVFDKDKFVYEQIKIETILPKNLNNDEFGTASINYSDLLEKIKLSLLGAVKQIQNENFLKNFVKQ